VCQRGIAHLLQKFWATQFVPQPEDGAPLYDNYIVPSVPLREEPYTLPKDLEWTTVDIDDPDQVSRHPVFHL